MSCNILMNATGKDDSMAESYHPISPIITTAGKLPYVALKALITWSWAVNWHAFRYLSVLSTK